MNESKREEKKNDEQIKFEAIRTRKSCKGYLYYSSTLKSKLRNPRCVGFPRTLPPVKKYYVGGPVAEASKKRQALLHFYYGCLGYSVYMDANANGSSTTDKHKAKLEFPGEFPGCVGLELIVNRAPEHVHNKEDRRELPKGQPQAPQSQPYRPAPSHSPGDDFYSRFTKSASLVASGVARNVLRVGTYVKENVEDILFRRPK